MTLIALVLMPIAAVHASPPPASLADEARAMLREHVESRGGSWDHVANQPVTSETHLADGTLILRQQTVDDAIERIFGSIPPLTASKVDAPTVAAGNMFHIYVNQNDGQTSAIAYQVTRSAFAPATPTVFLPPPATDYFFVAGGPMTNVKGADYTLGLHMVGTLFGSNVEISEDRVFLPVVDGDFVEDSSIDFLGHAIIDQIGFCDTTWCFAVGTMYGTGVARWDAEPVAGIDVDLPVVP